MHGSEGGAGVSPSRPLSVGNREIAVAGRACAEWNLSLAFELAIAVLWERACSRLDTLGAIVALMNREQTTSRESLL